ncbi:predicted protein [Uncinocarpus reesii 1704]|uniref:Uncharacterized protein n=1 Tax=Uncinocarpus reesii (strain UAMH 1704) TaxID=336963 RepID=C4JVW6_UNCRE|nr:uncharacterized protein UREG_06708 [Uncinocarpus reesii 1704]EEP81843.1 predicted protein [Uncinocarpus reesii 1704]
MQPDQVQPRSSGHKMKLDGRWKGHGTRWWAAKEREIQVRAMSNNGRRSKHIPILLITNEMRAAKTSQDGAAGLDATASFAQDVQE